MAETFEVCYLPKEEEKTKFVVFHSFSINL